MVLNVILYQRGARLRCRIPSHQPLRDKKNQNKPVSWLHTHRVQVCLRESWCFRRAQRGALAKVLSENPQSPQAGNARTCMTLYCYKSWNRSPLQVTSPRPVTPRQRSPAWPSLAASWTQISHLPPPAPFAFASTEQSGQTSFFPP